VTRLAGEGGEEAQAMQIETQMLSALPSQEGPLDGAAAGSSAFPGADGTLLAVVPIPGTGTSLAIVGYPVSNETVARRSGDDQAPAAAGDSPGPLAASAGLVLDHDQRRVWAQGREIPLTYQEFELLAFLSAHPATVFSRADLAAQVWQRDFAADSRTVDVHVSRLRHKLGPHYGRYLVTEYRVGYQFRPVRGLAASPRGREPGSRADGFGERSELPKATGVTGRVGRAQRAAGGYGGRPPGKECAPA
jgi:DNA-binding winged helix-turn-helix (wHTH) protein